MHNAADREQYKHRTKQKNDAKMKNTLTRDAPDCEAVELFFFLKCV